MVNMGFNENMISKKQLFNNYVLEMILNSYTNDKLHSTA